MASELHVDAIKHSGGTSAMTIDSTGRVLTPARPSFQYDISGYSGGTNYLASTYRFGEQNDNAIDTAYFSPLPFVNSISSGGDGFTTNVGSCASFVDHPVSSSYKYLKFTAPVAGLYCFGMVCHFTNQHTASDYVAFGLAKNRVTNVSSNSSGTSDFDKPFCHGQPGTGGAETFSGTNIIDLVLNDYVVFSMRSVQELQFQQSSMLFFGYLIG
tara:strand:+ start:482 stop:1120 length:639 start_codon:yes stop_codon:yes gene_type:complete